MLCPTLLGKNICSVAPSESSFLLGEIACLSKKKIANPCEPNWLSGLGKDSPRIGPCLVHPENQKIFKISRHFESCGTCMKH
jgi:hypothetical protein